MIARAYHNDADALARQLREPKAENEAQTNRSRKLIADDLENAHATYLEVQQTITLAGNAGRRSADARCCCGTAT